MMRKEVLKRFECDFCDSKFKCGNPKLRERNRKMNENDDGHTKRMHRVLRNRIKELMNAHESNPMGCNEQLGFVVRDRLLWAVCQNCRFRKGVV